MKRNLLLTAVVFIFLLQINAQNSQLDTWSIGFGANNTILHGDLTSLNSENNEPINIGFYVYVDKMITPAFGFELKAQMTKIKGSSQDFAPGLPRLYTDGETLGGEFNAIINLNGLSQNPYARANRKLNFSTYLGLGYHTYNSKLFDLDTDELITDFETVNGRSDNAKSIYYTAGLGIKYRVSSKFDIELRQTANFNNEDHLDAIVHQKQVFETFFTTNLGLVYKLNKKDSDNIIWHDADIIDNIVEIAPTAEPIKLNDTDGDGVIDQFDKEPNTPKGALTYGNGVAIDTDHDGIIDFNDKCPLKFGAKELDGCPIEKDTDGDGLSDKEDLCPNTAGPIDNQGCPIIENTITEVEKTTILNLAKNIYFTSGKSLLRDSAKRELDKIGDIMSKHPNINFVVEGHTDSGGKRAYNLQLSQNRANAVQTYLIRIGIDPSNLKAIGYGFSIPKYTNRTSGGRQLNRRVEIKINDGSVANTNIINNTFTEIRHTVIKEDTLFSISKKYNVTVDQLKEWNNLTDNNIIIGNTIIIRQ